MKRESEYIVNRTENRGSNNGEHKTLVHDGHWRIKTRNRLILGLGKDDSDENTKRKHLNKANKKILRKRVDVSVVFDGCLSRNVPNEASNDEVNHSVSC